MSVLKKIKNILKFISDFFRNRDIMGYRNSLISEFKIIEKLIQDNPEEIDLRSLQHRKKNLEKEISYLCHIKK